MQRGKILAVAVLILVAGNARTAAAATLEVPGQHPTIAAALENAQSGDTINLAPGRYLEHGLVLPAALTLVGTGEDPGDCIIDGQGLGRILSIEFLEDVSLLQGLTFTNGWANSPEGYEDSGGALFINRSRVRVLNCRFVDNRADGDGGAVRAMKASPLLIDCDFQNNLAGKGGGALDCSYEGSPLVQNSSFVRNRAAYGGALACRGDSHPMFINCRFDRNSTEGELAHGGAVLSFFWGEPTFSKCTFSRNNALVGGALFADAGAPVNLTSCTVASNTALGYGAGLFNDDAASEIKSTIIAFQDGIGLISQGTRLPVITCTNIYGNDGGDWIGSISPQASQAGNLSVDPLFCTENLDVEYTFNLQEGSPCSLDGGACADLGAWPVGCDTEVETPISLMFFRVEWIDGMPVIVWEILGTRGPTGFRLTRSSLEHPEIETEIAYGLDQNGQFMAQDADFTPVGGETYFYRLYLVMEDGGEFLLGTADLEIPPPAVALALDNVGAWPNPFNPQTTIHFELAAGQRVRVEIFGIDGRRVRTLADRNFEAGPQNLTWNGDDDDGRVMASGPYLVVVTGRKDAQRLKVTLLK